LPRAASTIDAPASAMAWPMAFPIPLLPPVTMATLPSSDSDPSTSVSSFERSPG
jgi:hypothetical protein